MKTRVILQLALAFLTYPVVAQVCELNNITGSENFQIKAAEDFTITAIQGKDLNDDARGDAAGLFSDRVSSIDDITDRVKLFLSANQDSFNIAESNLRFLKERLGKQNPPAFVAVDMSLEELAYLRKVAAILSLHRYAQVNALGARNAYWDKLLLIVVGPVVYLSARQPDLFHATAVMAMDDQALNPFQEALNWRGRNIPDWMQKVVGRGGNKEMRDISVRSLDKLPEGDGVFVLGNGLSPTISSAFVSACEKLRNQAPIPSNTEQANNVPKATEKTAAAEEQSRKTSTFNGLSRQTEMYRATNGTDAEAARKNAMARRALAYSWVTIDGAGHRWVHIRPIRYSR
jgi:hypothetical protein